MNRLLSAPYNKHKIGKKQAVAILFIMPFFVLYSIFTIFPVFQGIYVSLCNWNLMGKASFVGIENYKKMMQDKNFYLSCIHTVKFVIFSVPFLVILSFILALLANRAVCFRRFLRTAYYLPGVLSVSVSSYLASFVFAPYRGLLNGLLRSFRLLNSQKEILWLQNSNKVWFSLVAMTLWWTIGFSMLLYLAALQDIPEVLYDAAKVDGAAPLQIFWKITVPLLKPTIFLVMMLQIIASFKVFGQIHLMTGGGPANTTRSLIQYIYQQAFEKNKLGYASAMSYFLFVVLCLLVFIQRRFGRQEEG